MGQYHSTGSQKGTESNEGGLKEKVDYYELLDVQQSASGEENYGNSESATKLFAEIQSAYEVLSDPHERTWYDSHRDVFLGSDGNSGQDCYSYNTRMTTSSDILKLFAKFSPRMDFSDNKTGFFGGLRETFARLALEEETASNWDSTDTIYYPGFGSRDDDFEGVVRPFYAAWSGFSTKKSYAWKDVYRYSEAPDRRVRRLMEKENKRLREEGIREFNDAVRSLVAFVKKRDPRYKANAQTESQRQEHLRQSTAAQAARSRAVNQSKLRGHVTPDWAKSEEPEYDQNDSSDNETEHFECVVCHKNFKSQKQFEAHERSKKHLKAVKQLRWEMLVQDQQWNLDADASDWGENIISHVEQQQNTVFEFDDADADYASREAVEDRLLSEEHAIREDNHDEIDTLSHNFCSSYINKPAPMALSKMGKAKQKRARKAAQKAAGELTGLNCTICNASFPSRTQLFSHIRELGHAEPIQRQYG
ncbi:hypothetical protein ASPWEDRAFT_60727 [Aspergillus wentii DTO 134E9]|uniref:C2H2-type domain-containing protein n=1 Tax=Aspergillus wentii DTO 134E9 TaxID=1073089 RepID=A0A1L9RHB0_ASPWE|nr:uncharacterized protein ASPWEDRAFT_60727 [Aspergillus wentii DTO 134E9]OJJ34312.1 hypothetical protein ASPWEDRAFT_60727 [Aspergillus wentii DTO 134E9]